jgi:hypothetical protein
VTNQIPKTWDVFISHASEDKELFVRPLAEALSDLGVSVWYDEFSLRIGDSLSRSIDKGLAGSRFGLIVLSQAFLTKPWPAYELSGLIAREINEGRVILPIWHGVTKQQVLQFSPPFADKIALDTREFAAQDAAIRLLREVRPDLYGGHARAELERRGSGTAFRDLQREIERAQEELTATRQELAEYRCPTCGAAVNSRVEAPADAEEKHWDVRETFACGYRQFGGFVERPCPKDPRFPRFDDYDLQFHETPTEVYFRWQCYAIGKTEMARRLSLPPSHGRTREEAERSLQDAYDRCRG